MGKHHRHLRAPSNDRASDLTSALKSSGLRERDALSWESLSAAARLVLTLDGRPIRTIVTGRRFITTGAYGSRKAGRPLPYESMNERAFFMHSEVDTEVVDYRAQHGRFEFLLDGRNRAYIFDCVRLLADGSVEIVEVKNDRRALTDPDYAAKLDAVRALCRNVGWRFRIVYRQSLFEPQWRFAAIKDIQSWKHTAYGLSDSYRVTDALDRYGPLPLAALADRLGDRGQSVAKIKAMTIGRIISLDLTVPLTNETRVTLVNPSLTREI